MTLRCAVCSGEVRMIRVMRGYLRLGHIHQPPTLHPVQLPPQRGSMSGSAPRSLTPRVAEGARRPT